MMSQQAIELPAPSRSSSVSLEETLAQRRSVRSFSDTPLTLAEIGQLLWAAQGISEPRRGLRTAPSAGATYPLEIDVVIGIAEGIAAGVYRYTPGEHALRPLDQERLQDDQRHALAQAGLNQSPLHSAPVTFAISAVHARTAARYGDRATRYVDMEVGHAAQNLSLQAVALGLGSVVIGAFNDREVASVLGLSSGESPLYLIPVGTPR